MRLAEFALGKFLAVQNMRLAEFALGKFGCAEHTIGLLNFNANKKAVWGLCRFMDQSTFVWRLFAVSCIGHNPNLVPSIQELKPLTFEIVRLRNSTNVLTPSPQTSKQMRGTLDVHCKTSLTSTRVTF
ncbi:hypothetical protein ElyMa_005827800 [Elysia marginata]|uniref:Uncharacterized protein n=1 Tax=Elysia marginata TaxID=1093978 RepID=A0AAV4FVT8_9GAST|nr:hypothetical protein ElyMa_005827800 [Elysia marginata]